MEPMALGSPSGSPATNCSPYLPSFLLGESQAPATPNTLSPNKCGARNLSFAPSPIVNSPTEYNRSLMGQKTLFGYQQTPPVPAAAGGNYPGTPIQNHNASVSGPPTQGLFDSLRTEQNQVQTPKRPLVQSQFGTPTPVAASNQSAYGINQNYQHHQSQQLPQYNESLLSNASFNTSRCMVSPLGPTAAATPTATMTSLNTLAQCTPTPRCPNFWITVYGFPPSAASSILQHFAQCGTIIDKVFPPQNGNWVHLKYSSRLECDKALNYNEKILGNHMIGVTHCKERSIVDKENVCDLNTQTPKVRPLAQTAYKNAQNDSAVVVSQSAPQKSSGLMNKAMDLFFGW